MVSSKREIRYIKADSENRRKRKGKKLICWLFVDLVVAATVIALLLHRPGGYDPADFDAAGYESGQVSPYLTHELSPQIYNGAQREKPFNLVITQEGINEIVASWGWPKMSHGVILHSPAVLFKAGSVLLMGTADLKGAELIVTIKIEPQIDDEGMLSFRVTKVKVGAMNITPLARVTAERMYAQKVAGLPIDREAFQTKIAESLLNGVPFDPVFKVDGRKLRIATMAVERQRLVARLAPAS